MSIVLKITVTLIRCVRFWAVSSAASSSDRLGTFFLRFPLDQEFLISKPSKCSSEYNLAS